MKAISFCCYKVMRISLKGVAGPSDALFLQIGKKLVIHSDV